MIIPAGWSFLLALGIPDSVTQAAQFPVAHTIGTDFGPAARPAAETVTYRDGWTDS